MSAAVEFKNVTKQFPGASYPALDNISLSIEQGELVTVLGTSGCGKTTLIKLINRIHEADAGEILVEGINIQQHDPVKLRQKIGYVMQSTGLFPHWSVGRNIAAVPQILKWDKERIRLRVDQLLHMVNLDPEEFRDRYPWQLSGGQQQRIGLVRALAADPGVMLLDEPFGAIDAINREKLQDELLRLHRQTGRTFIFVTHDIHEALKLGTKVLVMDKGKIEQYASPKEIVANPATPFVRSLIQSANRQESGFAQI